jgi:hypothetical protein
MLFLAWYLKSEQYEFLAYKGLSLQNFYLGKFQKARHYNERVIRGKSENILS